MTAVVDSRQGRARTQVRRDVVGLAQLHGVDVEARSACSFIEAQAFDKLADFGRVR